MSMPLPSEHLSSLSIQGMIKVLRSRTIERNTKIYIIAHAKRWALSKNPLSGKFAQQVLCVLSKIHVILSAHARLWALFSNPPSVKFAHRMFCVLSKNP